MANIGAGIVEVQRVVAAERDDSRCGAPDRERFAMIAAYQAARKTAREREMLDAAVSAWLPEARAMAAQIIRARSLSAFDLEGEEGYVLLRCVQCYRGDPERFGGFLNKHLRYRLLDCARRQGLGKPVTLLPLADAAAVAAKPDGEPIELGVPLGETAADRMIIERYADGYTMKEIAEALGTTRARVSAVVCRVRQALRRRFPALAKRRIVGIRGGPHAHDEAVRGRE